MVGNVFSRKTVDVPNVVGKSVVEAQKTLEKSGFTVKLDEEYDEKVTPGYVIKQEPEGISKRKEGSEINFGGKQRPGNAGNADLIGRKLDNAKKFLSDLGYETGVVTYKLWQANRPILFWNRPQRLKTRHRRVRRWIWSYAAIPKTFRCRT